MVAKNATSTTAILEWGFLTRESTPSMIEEKLVLCVEKILDIHSNYTRTDNC